MKAAILNGLVGSGLTAWLGYQLLGLGSHEVIRCILVSNFAGVLALLITLRAQRVFSWMSSQIAFRTLKTWIFTASIYFGILLAFVPALRDFHCLMILAIPLILPTGYGIIVFGPIQDFFVRSDQRKARRLSA
jgi:hypothetical protein